MAVQSARDYFRTIYNVEPYNSPNGRKIHRLARIVADLDRSKPDLEEVEYLLDRFRNRSESAHSSNSFAEYALLAGHLAWLGSLLGDQDCTNDFLDFSTETHAEGLLHSKGAIKDTEASLIFRLQNHERAVSSEGSSASVFRRDLFERLSREHFFPRVLAVIKSVWSDHDIGIAPFSLDANQMFRNDLLQFIHLQLLQNALTHAYASPTFNQNYAPLSRRLFSSEGDDFLFGIIAYLEVELIDPAQIDARRFINTLASYHPALVEKAAALHDEMKRRKTRFAAFSYCDTGPGIERHIRHFSPRRTDIPRNADIKYMLDRKISGRTELNSGEGLNDVRRMARQAKAYLVIETPDSLFLENTALEMQFCFKNKRLPRGTSVSVIVEV